MRERRASWPDGGERASRAERQASKPKDTLTPLEGPLDRHHQRLKVQRLIFCRRALLPEMPWRPDRGEAARIVGPASVRSASDQARRSCRRIRGRFLWSHPWEGGKALWPVAGPVSWGVIDSRTFPIQHRARNPRPGPLGKRTRPLGSTASSPPVLNISVAACDPPGWARRAHWSVHKWLCVGHQKPPSSGSKRPFELETTARGFRRWREFCPAAPAPMGSFNRGASAGRSGWKSRLPWATQPSADRCGAAPCGPNLHRRSGEGKLLRPPIGSVGAADQSQLPSRRSTPTCCGQPVR